MALNNNLEPAEIPLKYRIESEDDYGDGKDLMRLKFEA